MAELIRETLFDQTKDHSDRLATLDFDRLRQEMSVLFEAAAHAVQVAGYEQDDAVIDRFVECRVRGKEVIAKADQFSTQELFTTSIIKQLKTKTISCVDVGEVEIVSMRVTAILERWPD